MNCALKVWANNTCITPPLLIEMAVSSQVYRFLPLLDFGTILTMWYILFLFLYFTELGCNIPRICPVTMNGQIQCTRCEPSQGDDDGLCCKPKRVVHRYKSYDKPSRPNRDNKRNRPSRYNKRNRQSKYHK